MDKRCVHGDYASAVRGEFTDLLSKISKYHLFISRIHTYMSLLSVCKIKRCLLVIQTLFKGQNWGLVLEIILCILFCIPTSRDLDSPNDRVRLQQSHP